MLISGICTSGCSRGATGRALLGGRTSRRRTGGSGRSALLRCGLVDRVIEGGPADYRIQVADLAEQMARSPHHAARLAAKARELAAAEKELPLAAYRHQELAVMSRNFFHPSEPFAQLRRVFVYKEKPTRTPSHLSGHKILLGSS